MSEPPDRDKWPQETGPVGLHECEGGRNGVEPRFKAVVETQQSCEFDQPQPADDEEGDGCRSGREIAEAVGNKTVTHDQPENQCSERDQHERNSTVSGFEFHAERGLRCGEWVFGSRIEGVGQVRIVIDRCGCAHAVRRIGDTALLAVFA